MIRTYFYGDTKKIKERQKIDVHKDKPKKKKEFTLSGNDTNVYFKKNFPKYLLIYTRSTKYEKLRREPTYKIENIQPLGGFSVYVVCPG